MFPIELRVTCKLICRRGGVVLFWYFQDMHDAHELRASALASVLQSSPPCDCSLGVFSRDRVFTTAGTGILQDVKH